MSRNWILALVAAVIWIWAYGWYFIGMGQVKATFQRLLRRLPWPRSGKPP